MEFQVQKDFSHTDYCVRMSCCVYFEFISVSYPLPVIPSFYSHVHAFLWLVLDGCNCKTMRCFCHVLLDTKYWCHWYLFGETPLRDPFHWTAPSPTEMQHRPRRNTGVQSVVRIFVLFFLLGGIWDLRPFCVVLMPLKNSALQLHCFCSHLIVIFSCIPRNFLSSCCVWICCPLQ